MSRAWLLVLVMGACRQPEPEPDPVGPATVSVDGELFGLVGESVSLVATRVDAAVSARWDYGDGVAEDVGPDTRTTHTYTTPGHYVAVVQVVGADQARVTATLRVTITWPLAEAPARSSSSVASGAGRVFVALEDFDRVAVLSEADWTVLEHLETCAHPRWLSFLPGSVLASAHGVLAVACREGEPGVTFFSIVGDEISPLGTLDLTGTGRAPTSVVMADDGRAWVSTVSRLESESTLLRVDTNGSVVDSVKVGTDLRGLAIQGQRLLATRFRSPDTQGEFWSVNTVSGAVTAHALALAPGPDSDTDARGVPNYLAAVAIRPDGRTAVIGGLKDNIARGLVRDGDALDDESTVRADLRQIAMVADEGSVGVEINHPRLDNLDLFSGLAYAPRGDWLYALTYGTRTVQVLDAYELRLSGVVLDLGVAPDGIAVSEDGAHLLVSAGADRTLGVYSTRAPFEVERVVDLRPNGVEVLEAAVLRGKRIFANSADQRMSRFGYTSCASCHLDGDDDGRTWDFTDRGEGVRNTISLRGMANRVGAPIHWSGNFDEVQDFEADIRGPQAGLGFLSDALWAGGAHGSLGDPKAGLSTDLDALAAYVTSLEDVVVPLDTDADAGRAIFEDELVGCASCHPAGGTVSSWLAPGVPDLRDVGTLTASSGHRLGSSEPLPGVVIPSLHGLWATAPYLHDGSAATLRDVLVARNPADAHGVTSGLTEEQIEQLVAYLRTL